MPDYTFDITSSNIAANITEETTAVEVAENVLEVNSKNIRQSKKDSFLDFLAIESNKMPDNNYEMKIIFAGNSIIKIVSEVVEVT